MLRSI
ncbi:hypothetical protein MXB_5659 [Myxobolus squamalis]